MALRWSRGRDFRGHVPHGLASAGAMFHAADFLRSLSAQLTVDLHETSTDPAHLVTS